MLRDTWDDSLDCFILEKVVAVLGDILYEDLGIKDSNLKEEMYRQIDLVVNVAAITKFDERYRHTLVYTFFLSTHYSLYFFLSLIISLCSMRIYMT